MIAASQIAQIAVLVAIAMASSACQPGDQPGWEYMPDMVRGPSYKAFAPNPATPNGITLQRPVPGTIARGARVFHYGKGDAEAERAGKELTNPYHPDAPTLAKGKALYQIYCMVCHGEQGKGDGPIASKIPPPPSYKSDRLRGFKPGRIFHVITLGASKMPAYAAQLAPDERWLIATYIRASLQDLEEALPGDLPPPPASELTPVTAPIPIPNMPGAAGTLSAAAATSGEKP